MYCQSCGAQNGDAARFCSVCGTPFEKAVSSVDREKAYQADRKMLLNEVSATWNKFKCQTDNYNQLLRLTSSISSNQSLLRKTKGLIVAMLWACFGLWSMQLIELQIGTIIILGLFFFSPLAISLIVRVVRHFEIKSCIQKQQEISKEIIKHYNSVENNLFAFEYSSPHALHAIYEVLRQGKADTIKEAITVLENEKYRSEMLNLQGQILEEARAAKNAALGAAAVAGIAVIRS